MDDDDVLARSKESAEDTQVKLDEATKEVRIKINKDKTKIITKNRRKPLIRKKHDPK